MKMPGHGTGRQLHRQVARQRAAEQEEHDWCFGRRHGRLRLPLHDDSGIRCLGQARGAEEAIMEAALACWLTSKEPEAVA